MTLVLLGKNTATGEFFETNDLADIAGISAGAVLVVGADGTLTELTGTEDGQTLVWDAETGSWVVSNETFTAQRRLLEEILIVLLELRDKSPTPWFVSKVAELEMVLTEEVQNGH